MLIHWQQFSMVYTLIQHRNDIKMIKTSLVVSIEHHFDIIPMGRQMYFYYLEWLFVYNQNKSGYLQTTTLQVYYF